MKKAVLGLTALLLNCVSQSNPPKQYDRPNTKTELAQCLVKQEVIMYGAWYCTFCDQEKKSFGSEAWNVFKKNYVECSYQAGTQKEIKLCLNNNISTVPAWQFKDGKIVTGYKTLQELAELSGCN